MYNPTITSLQVGVIIFKEDDYIFTYCPSLDLIGYGETEKKAKESFNIVVDEYVRYTSENGTLIEDLTEKGWKIRDDKTVIPPSMAKSLRSNKEFGNIINKYDFKKQSIPLAIPV